MKQIIFSRNEGDLKKSVVQGIVKDIQQGTGGAAGKMVKVTIESDVYSKEESKNIPTLLCIEFWNSEKFKTADNINEYVNVGDYISALISEKDGKTSGFKFSKNNALYKFEAVPASAEMPKALAEYNILVGTVSNGKMSEDGTHYFTSMRFDKHVKEADDNGYISISLWNGNKTNPSLGTNAEKCLAPYKPEGKKAVYRRAAFVCTALTSYMTPEGDERVSCNAFSFDRS